MYHTTGFTKDEIVGLCGQIYVNCGDQAPLNTMLDQLVAWSGALKTLRSA